MNRFNASMGNRRLPLARLGRQIPDKLDVLQIQIRHQTSTRREGGAVVKVGPGYFEVLSEICYGDGEFTAPPPTRSLSMPKPPGEQTVSSILGHSSLRAAEV